MSVTIDYSTSAEGVVDHISPVWRATQTLFFGKGQKYLSSNSKSCKLVLRSFQLVSRKATEPCIHLSD